MSKSESIRKSVSKAYATAVTSPRQAGCCGGPGPLDDKAVSCLAGYERTALDTVPAEAAEYSFGCGDPLALAEIEPGDTVVDLGSGAGLDILLAAQRVGPTGRVIGIDMTQEMIDKAQQNIAASGLDNVEVRQALIEDLPVESQSVDWLISNCVINLSPEKDRVFAEIARVLKPGGRMLVSDIVAEELPQSIRDNEAVYNGCVGGAVSEPAYLDGLRRAGLDEVEVRQRFVYDAAQLEHMLGPGLHGADGGSCCGVGPNGEADAGAVAQTLAGHLWSAQVYARKP